MWDYRQETEKRIGFIRESLASAGARGIVYGNSGGKDSALVGILCKMACEDTLGIILPCGSKRNYEEDARDAMEVAARFGIAVRTLDLTKVKEALVRAMDGVAVLSASASANICPRLRMTALYAVAASENRLVAGTGNRSEGYMGYFTKWGDGAYDFNPIADLTVTEVYEFLRYLGAPESVIQKAPSAGLFDGQTDEGEMGIAYRQIDAYLLTGEADRGALDRMERYHAASQHKRQPPRVYGGHV